MSKRTIVLADSSYTIRRIVELSFSEIDDVEVASFENGQGLKEKLLSLKPDVVIADIKLPDLNGYEICRFINSTEALKKTRAYLLKGSFEPIDGEQLKNLRYQDIITKPFDSNVLVSSVMKILEEQSAQAVPADIDKEVPGTLPEDFAEIETEEPGDVGISFSDIRVEMQERIEPGRPGSRMPERDDVQPSEEITQGTQPVKDSLAPEVEETFDNPFADESVSQPPKPAVEPVKAPPAPEPRLPEIEFAKAEPEIEESFGVGDKFPEFTSEEDTSEAARKSALDAAAFGDKEDEFPGEISVGMGEELKSADGFAVEEFPSGLKDFAPPAPPAKPEPLFEARPEKEFLQESHDDYRNRVAPEIPAKAPKTPLDQEISDFFAEPAKPEPRRPIEMPAELSLQEKSEMISLVEDKLTLAIKELLWEIIPPLAEKIIKEEIDRIKAELKSSEG